MDDRGQALPLVLAAVACTVVAVAAAGSLGARLVQYQQARSAADAAALAALTGGPDEARRLCRFHGCTVVDVVVGTEVATVRVRVGATTATASAGWTASP